jgi:hypothetical protein
VAPQLLVLTNCCALTSQFEGTAGNNAQQIY